MVNAIIAMSVLMEVKCLINREIEEKQILLEGSCSNVTKRCQCLVGYGGLMCELDINECAGNERICGAYSCTNLPGDYKCDCDFFHSGKQCQKGMRNNI